MYINPCTNDFVVPESQEALCQRWRRSYLNSDNISVLGSDPNDTVDSGSSFFVSGPHGAIYAAGCDLGDVLATSTSSIISFSNQEQDSSSSSNILEVVSVSSFEGSTHLRD